MLRPELLRHRRIVESVQVEGEGIETRLDLSGGNDKNARDANGLLNHQLRGLCDNGGDVGLGRHPLHF